MKTAMTEKTEPASEKIVFAERNDSLSEIIQRAYGRYTDGLLAKVLKENPEIQKPHFILIGQKIRLPELEPKDLGR
jgi:nucleoid-associated protein YgaU